jgi:hypothetical protein
MAQEGSELVSFQGLRPWNTPLVGTYNDSEIASHVLSTRRVTLTTPSGSDVELQGLNNPGSFSSIPRVEG